LLFGIFAQFVKIWPPCCWRHRDGRVGWCAAIWRRGTDPTWTWAQHRRTSSCLPTAARLIQTVSTLYSAAI